MRIGDQRARDGLRQRSNASLPVAVPKRDSSEAVGSVVPEEIKHPRVCRIGVLRRDRKEVHAIVPVIAAEPFGTELVALAWGDGVHVVILAINLNRPLSWILNTFLGLIPPLLGSHALPVDVLQVNYFWAVEIHGGASVASGQPSPMHCGALERRVVIDKHKVGVLRRDPGARLAR